MAGDIFSKERSIITLTSSGSSLTNLTGGAGNGTASLDCRTGGNAAEDYYGVFELTCQWATITSITAGVPVAELYLVPKPDGTNLIDVDTTSGASQFPFTTLASIFVCAKAPSSNTDMKFVSDIVMLQPLLYVPYIKNKSGQTISANWTLKVVTSRNQYS